MTGDSRNQLTSILKGDLKGVKKPNPTIIVGPRVRNTVWRKLIEKYYKQGMSEGEIIKRIIAYDDYVEKGIVTAEKIKLYKESKKI